MFILKILRLFPTGIVTNGHCFVTAEVNGDDESFVLTKPLGDIPDVNGEGVSDVESVVIKFVESKVVPVDNRVVFPCVVLVGKEADFVVFKLNISTLEVVWVPLKGW